MPPVSNQSAPEPKMFATLMGLKTISPADLLALTEKKQVTVFDVNSRQSWQEAHVPGAVHSRSAEPRG